MSSFLYNIRPARNRPNPATALRSVLFPAPLLPSSAVMPLSQISIETLCSTMMLPYPATTASVLKKVLSHQTPLDRLRSHGDLSRHFQGCCGNKLPVMKHQYVIRKAHYRLHHVFYEQYG
jgi:hypothetical protein